MTVLLICLMFIGLIFFFERLIFLHKSQIQAVAFLLGIKNLVKKQRVLEAITVCEGAPGPIPQIVKVALLHQESVEHQLRGEVQKAAILQVPVLQQRIGVLWLIAHMGPLLGLLGVVSAFLQGFLKMQAEGPYGTFSLFSSEVIQALTTLSVGLLCSILAYLGHFFLKSRVQTLLYDIEWSASDIVQFLLSVKDTSTTEEDVFL